MPNHNDQDDAFGEFLQHLMGDRVGRITRLSGPDEVPVRLDPRLTRTPNTVEPNLEALLSTLVGEEIRKAKIEAERIRPIMNEQYGEPLMVMIEALADKDERAFHALVVLADHVKKAHNE